MLLNHPVAIPVDEGLMVIEYSKKL